MTQRNDQMFGRTVVQLCKNNLSDGSNTYDVFVRQTVPLCESQDEVVFSPASLKDAEAIIETLERLAGAERIDDMERSY